MTDTTEVTKETSLFDLCREFLEIYPDHKQQFSGDTDQVRLAHRIAIELKTTAELIVPSENWKGDASCGLGNWSKTPWAALYDIRETDKASSGVCPTFVQRMAHS